MTVRDFNVEYQDGARKYAYDFDGVIRRYMMKTLAPHFRPGRALELGCYTGEVTELIAQVYDDLTVVEASSELAEAVALRLGGRARVITATIETAHPRARGRCGRCIEADSRLADGHRPSVRRRA